MKNGLLVYSKGFTNINIGDYIQSVAAKQFLEGDLIYVERERLDEYDGEILKLIMNGWFLHGSKHWPPSSQIAPVFISFHLNSNAYDILDSMDTIEYFKKHEPIGCRDEDTADLLRKKGISSYFSGCLTLTLGEKFNSNKRNNKVYFVDPYFYFNPNLTTKLKNIIIFLMNIRTISIISKKMYSSTSLGRLNMTTSFFKTYKSEFSNKTLRSSSYLSHIVSPHMYDTEEKRLAYAEELLVKYSEAKFIITSRIHCALPSLGMGTPVIYTDALKQSLNSSCRFGGLINLFNTYTIDKNKIINKDIYKEKKGYHLNFENKKDYISIKNNLISSLKSILENI